MPSSPRDPNGNAVSVQSYLETLLPDSTLTSATVDSAYQPLLFLHTSHVIAAFAFSNGDMRKSYEATYRGFKNYYSEQQGRWDAVDLAFVFCVKPEAPNLDDFCSSVETDIYFCRKFVVPLVSPLASALARLPFLPLAPLDGETLRPPSAQTFLQRCGVPAGLAKSVVVQRERSAEGIVEDCIAGDFGEPKELKPLPNRTVVQAGHSAESVLLETIVIKNFRAYRKQQTFEFGSDVTILYGPNGFGKTSFFDAVDFGVTGEIGRIKASGEAHFKKTAQHLDSGSEESVVSLYFRNNGASRKITRNVSNRKQALLDGRSADRKTILSELTSGDIPATDRVENFVSLFRATHLFNQEQPELTRDFQDDCRLPSEIVSRMLAFEDYANAVSKAGKVRGVIQSTVKNTNTEIRELSEQIADEKKELARLEQTAKIPASADALDKEIRELRGKLKAVGIVVATQKPDPATVRSWRASVEARLAESQSQAGRIASLAKEVAALPRMRTELTGLQSQLNQKEREFEAVEQKRLTSDSALQRAKQFVTERVLKSEETQTRVDVLEWIRATKPAHEDLLRRQQVLADELNRASAELNHNRVAQENAVKSLRECQSLSAQAMETQKARQSEITALQRLTGSVASWLNNRTRLGVVIEQEQAAIKSLEALRADGRELNLQVTEKQSEAARLSRLIAQVDKSQSELRNLLTQLLGHVESGVCPLCGEDHGSKDELIGRIQNHVTGDTASGARTELKGIQGQISELAERIADNNQKDQATEGHLSSLRTEQDRLMVEIDQFVESTAKLGVVLPESSSTVIEQLQTRSELAQKEIGEVNQQVQERAVALQKARTELANAQAAAQAKGAEVSELQTNLDRLQGELNQLRSDPRLVQFPLDMNEDRRAELYQFNRTDLAQLKADLVKRQADLSQKKTEIAVLLKESEGVGAQISILRGQVADVQKTLMELAGRLEEFGLPADINEQIVLERIASASQEHAQLLSLRDSVSNIEIAIDATTTSAVLTQLRQNVVVKEKAFAAAVRRRDQHQPWLKYFEDLSTLVSTQQSVAIDSFTREYGPRTSVIQRRLRSVYGFDEIEIRSRESSINVRVRRGGEELRPTDYFSQSQQQTLFLGLFLTACISQTWSTFSPVFLDDPVTHFDDLNTYAFLDLIVGLLESKVGRRQFVISTCDERLLQLARQKFRHLGDRARFYRFSAIGADGPVVGEISTHSDGPEGNDSPR
jgi:DNA repair protein SbcC/Rad50